MKENVFFLLGYEDKLCINLSVRFNLISRTFVRLNLKALAAAVQEQVGN